MSLLADRVAAERGQIASPEADDVPRDAGLTDTDVRCDTQLPASHCTAVTDVDVLIDSAYGRMIVNRHRARLPPVMQRTRADDLRWAVFVLAGATLGYFAFGAGDASVLLGCTVGAVVAIVVLNVIRTVRRRS